MFYIYDTITKEYLRSTQGQESPLEPGTYFTPASSTEIQPMDSEPFKIPVWNGTSWDLLDDYRLEDYWYKDTALKVEFTLGDSVNSTMTELEPQEGEIWNGTSWESTLSDAQEEKTIEINIYADSLIEDAYANPTQSTVTDPVVQRNTMNVRRNNKSDKIAGEITLTQDEKDEAKTDQKLSEYEQKIVADQAKAIENMMKLNTSEEVLNFDVSAENWNVWIPPV